jgi:hypothetical protein
MAVTAPTIPLTGVATANPSGQNCSVTVTGGTVTGLTVGYGTNPAPVIVTPAIPLTTVPATNTNPFPVAVSIVAGTVTVVAVSGVTQFTATGVTAIVPAGGTIALTYSVVPTSWTWTPVVAGITGNPVSSPNSLPVPPGCTLTWTGSVAPTSWAWNNFIDQSYTPGFYAMNTGAEGTGYNPYTQLPYAQHTAGLNPVLGISGLGVGVAN